MSLIFMAASPRGGGVRLRYEAEGTGILTATERLPLGLSVEETGCAEFLRERILLEGPFEALHPVYEQLGDIREAAITRLKIIVARLHAGQGAPETIEKELADVLGQFQTLGTPDGIAVSGFLLAQVRAGAGRTAEALTALDAAQAASNQLGDEESVRMCRELRSRIEHSGD